MIGNNTDMPCMKLGLRAGSISGYLAFKGDTIIYTADMCMFACIYKDMNIKCNHD